MTRGPRWILYGKVAARVLLVGLSAALIVTTVVGSIGPWIGLPIGALLLGVAALLERLMGPLERVVSELERTHGQESERTKRLATLLATDRPLRVRDVDPYQVGVTRSKRVDEAADRLGGLRAAYVNRQIDAELRQELRAHRPLIVLVGDSRAGKSRTLFEAISSPETELPDHLLLAPARYGVRPDTLTELFAMLGEPARTSLPSVLWLDDLHVYLDWGALTADFLNRCRGQLIVVGTMQTEHYERLRFGGQAAHDSRGRDVLDASRKVLERATVITLASDLTAAEIADAERIFPGTDWSRRRLGEELVLGPELCEKLRTADHAHAALVRTIVAWGRAGVSRPITRSELTSLLATEPSWAAPHAERRAPDIDMVLAWARATLPDSESALVYESDGGLVVNDFVAAYVAREADVAEETWELVAGLATVEEAFAVGLAANRHELLDVALHAWSRAAEADSSIAVPALLNKAAALEALGALTEAIRVYDQIARRWADDRYRRAAVARAHLSKGLLLERLGRPLEALTAYDEATGPYDDQMVIQEVVNALIQRGRVLRRLGRSDEALAVYDKVTRWYDRAWLQQEVATALMQKGILLTLRGQHRRALAVLDQVLWRSEGSSDEQVASALVCIGHAQVRLGLHRDALATSDELVSRFASQPDKRASLALGLINRGDAFRRLGLVEEALTAYDEAWSRCGQEATLAHVAAAALVQAGVSLRRAGRMGEALEKFDEVLRRYGDTHELVLAEEVARALINRGVLLRRMGRLTEAYAVHDELVRRYGHVTERPLAVIAARARRLAAGLAQAAEGVPGRGRTASE